MELPTRNGEALRKLDLLNEFLEGLVVLPVSSHRGSFKTHMTLLVCPELP